MDSIMYTHHIPLDLRVEFTFEGEFYYEPNQIMLRSNVEQCFSPTFYPKDYLGEPEFEDFDTECFDCGCGGQDIRDGRGTSCICLQG